MDMHLYVYQYPSLFKCLFLQTHLMVTTFPRLKDKKQKVNVFSISNKCNVCGLINVII